MMLKLKLPGGALTKVSLLVLDCDGIIYDSNRLKTEAYRSTLQTMEVDAVGVDEFVSMHLNDVSVSRWVKFRRFFTEVRPDLCAPADVEAKVEASLGTFSAACQQLYNQLTPRTEALQLAQMVGADRAYVISGGGQDELREVFAKHNIAHHFKEICGSPTTKPDHLGKILLETGVAAEEVLFVGDGWTDYKTALGMGTQFIFLKEMSDWDDALDKMKDSPLEFVTADEWQDVFKNLTV
jgi:phosphoglycolate phosphatase-like HAD superfamily hydrolase